MNNYIYTYLKEKIIILDPKPEQIHIEDIAHSLSHTCRYAGHSKNFFSVAEHCVNAYDRIKTLSSDPYTHLHMLLHDASEAYLGDITSPLKAISPEYRRIEEHYERIIGNRFHIPWAKTELVHQIDMEMNQIEMYNFGWFPDPKLGYNFTLNYMSPNVAKANFLYAYQTIQEEILKEDSKWTTMI